MKATDIALARAAQRQPAQEIRALDVGGGWGFVGFELVPMKSPDGDKLGAMLIAVGTRQSLIASANLTFVKAAIAPLAEVTMENLRKAFEAAANPEGEAS